jgi:hypothetical protein
VPGSDEVLVSSGEQERDVPVFALSGLACGALFASCQWHGVLGIVPALIDPMMRR